MWRSLDKFLLLTWKNWLLQWRHPLQTAIEVLAPVIFSALLVLIRSLVDPEALDTIAYPEFKLDTEAGVFRLNENNTIPSEFQIQFVAWSPCGNEALHTIMENVASKYNMTQQCVNNAKILQDSLEAISFIATLVGVVFDDSLANNNNMLDSNMAVTLRFPGELRTSLTGASFIDMWWTNMLFPVYQMAGPRVHDNIYGAIPNYFTEGYLTVQHDISEEIIKHHLNQAGADDSNLPEVLMQRFPYPAWINDPLLQALQSFVGIIIMLSFVYTCINTVKVITTEKEKQLKEAMKIMGLPNWLHWTAWFLKIFFFLLISIILMVVLLKVSWYPDTTYSVFTHANAFVLFIFLMFYMFATITFCFAISVFFSNANTASTIAGLAWFLSYCPYLFMQESYNELSLGAKLGAMIFSNTAMAYGFQLVLMFEGTGEGLQWSNMFQPVNIDDDLTLAHVIMMLIIDTFVYLLIALYVEAVFPGDYGVAEVWYYPFTSSYWCGKKRYVGVGDKLEENLPTSDIYEEEPTNLSAGVKIRHLRKVYSNKKVAVRDLSLNMFEDQITVLLGHNGAGKTTTMSMLTGMITPTEGTATINGFDLRTELNGVRDSLGLCPQHNILFDDLTVAEHLYFFSKLKGMNDKKEIDAEIDKYVELLELVPKKHAKSSTLSGGMKRKLCVAMALCGKSKVCMFDEPTAGMDPAARRALWDLMQKQKKGRTILLSTHFMDEADLLGDRIAIMAGGKLQCCGTSFFLKKKYGAGYHLVMDKTQQCDVEKITNILRVHIPSITVENNVGSELTYLLTEEQASVFEEMLGDLENSSKQLGINSYGISLTTMEEVFMKVGADHGQEEENNESDLAMKNKKSKHIDVLKEQNGNNSDFQKHSSDTKLNVTDGELLTGFALKRNQLMAMMMKKVLSTVRSWVLLLIQNIIPIFFMSIAIIVARTMATTPELPAFEMSMDPYDNPITAITTDDTGNSFYRTFKRILTGENRIVRDLLDANFTADILQLTEDTVTTVRMRHLFANSFLSGNSSIVSWFNNEPFHTPPLALQYTMNTVLQTKLDSSYSISFTNHPMPFTAETQFQQLQQGNNMGFQIAFNVGFSMSFISSFYVLFYVRERVNKSKHLQFVSGANVGIYWVTAYVWDFLTYLVTALLMIGTLACFQEDGFSTGDEIGRIFLLLVMFGIAMLPEMYLASFLFEIPATGYTRMTLVNIFLGIAAFMVVQVLGFDGLNLENVADALHWVFLIVPHYSLSSGIQDMSMKAQINNLCRHINDLAEQTNTTIPDIDDFACFSIPNRCCDLDDDFLGWNNGGIGRNVVFMSICAVVLTILLLLKEYRVFDQLIYTCRKKLVKTPPADDVDDSDVLEEKRKVNSGEIGIKDFSVVLKNVTKYYDSFLAVNKLSLGIKGYECFGLLGVNGAGKTTTFKMMTGDVPISSGDAWIYGLNVKTDMKQVHKRIGYCPQFDALLDDLTGRETLIMYCLLRGVPYGDSKYIAESLAKEFDFARHIDKRVKEYSGGNKRKLSAAIALIGDPPIVFLDEPTTGMDPATKRNLWNTLCRIRDNGKCLVLTSHSMEECEALCTRLAIMVNGSFKCLGSTQHLKNKFSQGYTLTIKVQKSGSDKLLESTEIEPITYFVKSKFTSAILRECHQELLTFYIPDESLPWSKMFGIMEKAKKSLNIEDYSLGQASLEQVFLFFTKFQRTTDDD